jgi:hypothetical protein
VRVSTDDIPIGARIRSDSGIEGVLVDVTRNGGRIQFVVMTKPDDVQVIEITDTMLIEPGMLP